MRLGLLDALVSRMRKHGVALFILIECAACQSTYSDTANDDSNVSSPTADQLPEGMSRMQIEGGFAQTDTDVIGVTVECHASLVSPTRVLTAAHCFARLLPWDLDAINTRVFDVPFTAAQVHFHPNAWSDHEEAW